MPLPQDTPILLLDGGLGTLFESDAHFRSSQPPKTPLWSSYLLAQNPAVLTEAHSAYIRAGADVVLTATYQASVEGFARTPRHGEVIPAEQRRRDHAPPLDPQAECYTAEEAGAYMRSAIVLAAAAVARTRGFFSITPGFVGRIPRIALSLGPYGATLTPAAEYSGLYPAAMDGRAALEEWHAARLRVYLDEVLPLPDEIRTVMGRNTWEAVAFVAFETVRRCDEVGAIRAAMARLNVGGRRKEWWICGVFPATRDRSEEEEEAEVAAMTRAMLEGDVVGGREENADATPVQQPWGIGINCTAPERVARMVRVMERTMEDMQRTPGWQYEWGGPDGRPWLVLYPDGARGLRYDPGAMEWVKEDEEEEEQTPEAVGEKRKWWARELWATVSGAVQRGGWQGVLVGGCCMTGLDDICELRKWADLFHGEGYPHTPPLEALEEDKWRWPMARSDVELLPTTGKGKGKVEGEDHDMDWARDNDGDIT